MVLRNPEDRNLEPLDREIIANRYVGDRRYFYQFGHRLPEVVIIYVLFIYLLSDVPCERIRYILNLGHSAPATILSAALTGGTEAHTVPAMPMRPYASAQNGSAAGSFAASAAVPSPWQLPIPMVYS